MEPKMQERRERLQAGRARNLERIALSMDKIAIFGIKQNMAQKRFIIVKGDLTISRENRVQDLLDEGFEIESMVPLRIAGSANEAHGRLAVYLTKKEEEK